MAEFVDWLDRFISGQARPSRKDWLHIAQTVCDAVDISWMVKWDDQGNVYHFEVYDGGWSADKAPVWQWRLAPERETPRGV